MKISAKGQITLPKYIRQALGSERIRLILVNGQVRIEPVKSVAGSLRDYAKPNTDMTKETDMAWDAIIREQYATR
ncbi:AbrB/MazE/SpoVT family DNA-binding domain-containing protein [Candidatus Thiothrix sp. Deng01]|uniref:AbrB/MazE/SpoVT family DNA-binding domain-containing protein n=1 Tax=Candidatus Thiothrix phosphatis TaxID=3112415 RepID=A0ABU6CZJ3_9GAMM|nr:AbrB/MazE/SpoVT family DNA-binding domain-containing protein [Candidatus Thiothrix sp. Deng01]MEB4592246.1 AbrB/MazE/SpoVT family DNA-binding domain-containing protein [Candidatus Thiothrix sp. Deng01]